jgi:acetolactate synthase I/II/III large subunit
MNMMNGAECLLRTLLNQGVELCLMNPGTSEMQFVAALDRVPGMRSVLCLFEGVCSGAADGYARMLGKPAATLLHLGPGLANGLSNFHNARKARSPMVSIVGEHSTQHLRYDAPLTADIEAFARPVSGWVRTLESASRMGEAAAECVRAAYGPPGEVATLIIPADYSWSEAGAPGGAMPVPKRTCADVEAVRYAATLLRRGFEAGILLGGSALDERTLALAGCIAAETGARVFASTHFPRMQRGGSRYAPQRVAYFPEPAEAMLAGLRHLVLVESKPPVSFFGYPAKRSYLAPEDCEVHVLAGTEQDGRAGVEMLAEELGAVSIGDAWSVPLRAELPGEGPLTPHRIGRAVAALLPEHAIVSDEMVSSGGAVWEELVCAAPHDHLPVTGGSIGQGLPVAVGAALACPDRKVVALEADGSGMYTLQALWTMAREGLDVVTVIFSNRRYRILDVEMQRTGVPSIGPRANDMIDLDRPGLDWVKLAQGMGVEASRAETASEFIAQFAAGMRSRGPRLIEAAIG